MGRHGAGVNLHAFRLHRVGTRAPRVLAAQAAMAEAVDTTVVTVGACLPVGRDLAALLVRLQPISQNLSTRRR